MPRVLARLPYGASTKAIEAFNFEEAETNEQGKHLGVEHDNYCWMNASYTMGATLTRAFAEYGWCTAIRGAEGGGKVEGLPSHVFVSDDGAVDQKCPTEIGITERREAELSKLGFCPCATTKYRLRGIFRRANHAKPAQFQSPDATANAAISARLPYIMATSRIAHFLKVMARDKIGSFMEADEAERMLNQWIKQYVNGNPLAAAETKAKYPWPKRV